MLLQHLPSAGRRWTTRLAALALTTTPITALADFWGDHGTAMGTGAMGTGHWLVWLFWLGLIVLLVLAAAGLLRRFTGSGAEPSRALAILEERYARGEIDQQEFELKRRQLRS